MQRTGSPNIRCSAPSWPICAPILPASRNMACRMMPIPGMGFGSGPKPPCRLKAKRLWLPCCWSRTEIWLTACPAAWTRTRPPPLPWKIGRASCRERVEISVGAGSLKKKNRGNRRFECDWSSDVCSSDLLEPHGDLVDGLSGCMDADEAAAFAVDGAVTIGAFRQMLERHYAWALAQDHSTPENIARFWYVSAEKLEPRLGGRFTEDGTALELPIGTSRMAAELSAALAGWPEDQPLAGFLLAHPEHRFMVRRGQQSAGHPLGGNSGKLFAARVRPIFILCCKLGFFGASHFDPRSDRWVRIALFQGLPYPDEVTKEPQDA